MQHIIKKRVKLVIILLRVLHECITTHTHAHTQLEALWLL